MKIILGGPESGKSTILLHYVYNEIVKLLEQQINQSTIEKEDDGKISNSKSNSVLKADMSNQQFHACIITSKKKLVESKMIFGIYCEVSIEILREVKLKYIEEYEELVQFLADFHLLPIKPSILAIDSLDYFCDVKKSNVNYLTKQMRFNFLMSLIKDCQ